MHRRSQKRILTIVAWFAIFLWTSPSCKQEDKRHLLPSVGFTMAATDITDTSALCGGFVINPGGSPVIERGVCVSVYENPTVSDTKISGGAGVGSFTMLVKNLRPNTTYYARAYAFNEWGTAYGEQISFTAMNPNMPTFALPTIVGSIKKKSASVVVNVTTPGGTQVFERGVCLSTHASPSIAGAHIKDKGLGSGKFKVVLNDLQPGTRYYLCGYASNSSGTFYSMPIVFKTPKDALPSVQAPVVTNIGPDNATLTLSIDDEGENGPLTFVGACYSKDSIFSINDPKLTIIPLSRGVGTWSTDLHGLDLGANYHVRSLVTDSRSPKDTTLGGVETIFQTQGNVADLPVIVTLPPILTDQTARKGVMGAEIKEYGSLQIIEAGFCYDNGSFLVNSIITGGPEPDPVSPPITLGNTLHVEVTTNPAPGYFSLEIPNLYFPGGEVSVRAYVKTANNRIIYGNWYCASNWGAGGCTID